LASESIVLKSVSPQPEPARITYVLDTSVLLADPVALTRFAEHEVIIPITVIGELESKRDHPELGYFARAALRTLDDLRVKSGRLDKPIAINDDGGTLAVELNHADASKLPAGFLRDGSNDNVRWPQGCFGN
jgi:PhoH-like ATPase